MSLKKFSVGTLQSKKLSTYKFSSNRLSLRRFPFPAGPATSAIYVEDVFAPFIYTGTGNANFINNGIALDNTYSGTSAQFVNNNYLLRSSDLDGNSDGKTFTCSFWVFPTTTYHTIFRSSSSRVEILISSSEVSIDFKNTSGSSILRGATSAAVIPYGVFSHVLLSVNLAASTYKLYVNDVSRSLDLVAGPTNENIDFTDTSFGIGAYADGSLSSKFYLSHFFFDKTYRDLDNSTNRRLFITADSKPATGQSSLNPLIYLPFSSSISNLGTGGSFTSVGVTDIVRFGPDSTTGYNNGGLVWIKERGSSTNHVLQDTQRGTGSILRSNLTDAAITGNLTYINGFNASGFSLGDNTLVNNSNNLYASWTFRKQPKFFDVVTYTGNGADRTIAHNLGSVPGCIIVKCTNTGTTNWSVYHRGLTSATNSIYLDQSDAQFSAASYWNSTAPTSTVFSLGADGNVNGSGRNYVAYIFAHDAGGFGDLGTDNVISCGSFSHTSGGATEVNLGYEPQFLITKLVSSNDFTYGKWWIQDFLRGFGAEGSLQSYLQANVTSAEVPGTNILAFSRSNGFTFKQSGFPSGTYIYIAIRRGPMRTPTDASKVFQPVVYTGTNVDNRLVPTGILTDMILARQRNSATIGFVVGDRLRSNQYLRTDNNSPQVNDADSLMTPTVGYGNSFSAMNGFGVGNDATSQLNASTVASNQVVEAFQRAPGFFDIVTYTGTGVARTVNHNLGAVPKMMWIKGLASSNWIVYSPALGLDAYVELDFNNEPTTSTTAFNSTAPTSSVFSVGGFTDTNSNGQNYVAYLFGEIPGISKVSYYLGKGVGTVNQVDCGFTTGARFLLVKSLLGPGSWYVWDTARGIVAGNDPYILADTTSAEATGDDYVDSYAAGFELSTTAPEQLNGSYADNWDPQLAVAGTSNFEDIMYENGYWVAAASASSIYYSVSGYNWTQVTGVFAAGSIVGLAFGNGLYIAVGTSGRISTSSNLTSWTAQTSGVAVSLAGAAYAFGKYWACGNGGTVVSSADGVTWSTVSIGTANNLNRVRLLNGNLVFVGASGTIVTSADGINFTVRTSGLTDGLNDVTYGNGLYVIVGNSGTVLTSSNLATWTGRSAGGLAGNNIFGVIWTGNRFVAVATAGETGYSSDGITWSTGGGAGADPIYCVAYGNDMTIAGNGSGNFYASNPKFIFIAIA